MNNVDNISDEDIADDDKFKSMLIQELENELKNDDE